MAITQRYFGNFTDLESIKNEFADTCGNLQDADVLFAWYSCGTRDYNGDAIVLFQQQGKLYEVSASHCSCNGFEGQWDAHEVTWAQLAMRNQSDGNSIDIYDDAAKAARDTLINSHVPRA